jgi:hypothetical protein
MAYISNCRSSSRDFTALSRCQVCRLHVWAPSADAVLQGGCFAREVNLSVVSADHTRSMLASHKIIQPANTLGIVGVSDHERRRGSTVVQFPAYNKAGTEQ